MNILLFGCHGQVGRSIEPGLRKLGTVTAVDQEHVDIRNFEALQKLLDGTAPALIINTAAYTDVEGAESAQAEAQAVNSIAPEVMADWAAGNGAAMVHYSTDFVYPGRGDTLQTEETETGPLNVYGETKLVGDMAVIASGAPCVILRTSWLYASFGENFLKTMMSLGAARTELSVVSDQIGAPTSANFVAGATLEILAQGRADIAGFLSEHGGVYHAVCAGETSWHAYAVRIFEQMRRRGAELKVRDVKPILGRDYTTKAVRPLNSRLSCEKLVSRFGISPPRWEIALDQVLDEIY